MQETMLGHLRRARWILAAVAGLVWLPAVGSAQQRPEREREEKPPKHKYNLEKLKFMAGCWQGPIDRETMVEEVWTTPTENLMTSTTRYIKKDRATGYEFSRIESKD